MTPENHVKSQIPGVERRSVAVRGVVQGVGFRPFVYRLATEEYLAGFVGNDTDGVTIEVEGSAQHIGSFLRRLRTENPLLARIDALDVQPLVPTGESGFRIVSSHVLGRVSTGIPADAATCPDCLRELLDSSDRRFRYPFINCTNCGPRFTITRRIPYDRPQTSMAGFPMCPECQREYDDPTNRRFHAQPNACWVCGPKVWLEQADGAKIPSVDAITACIERLLAGEVMAIKGIGGFHLCVDACSETAVARLRQRKHRYGKPLAIMVRDIHAARALCIMTSEEEKLLGSPARPIVLVRARQDNRLAQLVAPGVPWLGIYLPYAPLQHLLFVDERVTALVMTSANLSEEPIAIDNHEARARLGEIADAFLMHDREILQRCDDSVSTVVDGAPQLIRRARGYVPLGLELPLISPPMLAVGGHLKNVFALASGQFAYQSQHLGDLENLTTLEFFTESLTHMMLTFEIEPQFVVHDLHPGYLSTSWAKDWAHERGLKLVAVQHHHAHVAGCMAEHGLTDPVIGLSLDGTGYGTDGRIWGGEVFICSLEGFERFAHLDYVPMPGGEAAIHEPWRMAMGHLHAAGFDVASAAVRKLTATTEQETQLLIRMMERGINAPLTSSLGRLFDAVAAIVLDRRIVDYEAQAAIELEGIAIDEHDVEGYELDVKASDNSIDESMVIHLAPMWHALLRDLDAGVSKQRIAAQFHAGIAAGLVRVAQCARAHTGLQRVVMSGGCLHNRRLARLLREGLERDGFEVFQNRRVSPGDGGLSYGQVAVACSLFANVKE